MITPLKLCWLLFSPQKGNRPFSETALVMALWSYGEGLIGDKMWLGESQNLWVGGELVSLFALFGWKLGMHISFLEEPLLFPFCWWLSN